MPNFTISEYLEDSDDKYSDVGTGLSSNFNVVFNDKQYFRLHGILHIDATTSKAIFITDYLHYNISEYNLKNDLYNIININRHDIYIRTESIYIIELYKLIEKVKNDLFDSSISTETVYHIGIDYNKNGINCIYNLLVDKPLNIISKINQLNISIIKRQLSKSIYNLLDSISIYGTSNINEIVLDELLYILSINAPLNLNIDNIHFLKYINNSKKQIFYENEGLIDEFTTLCNTFLTNEQPTIVPHTKPQTLIKNTTKYSIKLLIRKHKHHWENSYNLGFTFEKLPLIYDKHRYGKSQKIYNLFIINYLMYLNEYRNFTSIFKEKITQEL